MQEFFDEHGKKWPLMCMEFWDGWFNRWKEPIIKRDPDELAEAVHEVLQQGSINLYMFHGGTNFGFMNGCSARGLIDLPQVTSYDYDALLDERGNPTAKYYAVQRMLERPIIQSIHRWNHFMKKALSLGTFHSVEKSVSLKPWMTSSPIESLYPRRWKSWANIGYLLYRTEASWDADEERLRIIRWT